MFEYLYRLFGGVKHQTKEPQRVHTSMGLDVTPLCPDPNACSKCGIVLQYGNFGYVCYKNPCPMGLNGL